MNLRLREDGACSIEEERFGKMFRGGGAWWKTDQSGVVKVGLSSNSAMSLYHFFVRLDQATQSFILAEKEEAFNE